MMIDGADFFVRLVSFPVPAEGMTMPNDDGTFSVYINAGIPEPKQVGAYFHEVRHIESGDFCGEKDIREVESA